MAATNTFTMNLAFAAMVAVSIGLLGCGKKTPESKQARPDFDHPSPNMLQDIARKQHWQIEDVQLQHRVSDQIDARQTVSDVDWNAMVKAVEKEPVAFGDQFAGLTCMTSYPLEERFRTNILKWSENGMSQEESPGEAVNAYFSYALAKGPDRDVWKARLIARGKPYTEKMADEEEIIAKWQVKLARLEREAQNGKK
jgi:hypothetical protein